MKKYIYGTGYFGSLFKLYLSKMGVSIDAYIHTDSSIVETDGILIIPYNHIHNSTEEICVFIAINDKYVSRSLRIQLMTDIPAAQVYDCYSFINDNLVKNAMSSSDGNYYCNICGNYLDSFIPGGVSSELFRKYHVIGGGYRNNYLCPICKSIDRERWLKNVLMHKVDLHQINGKVLHIAPEKAIAELFIDNDRVDYYSCDINPLNAMHLMDITDIIFKDETFDLIICNHVLEHIKEEEKAIFEIRRVMKRDAIFVFSFPICMNINTIYNDLASSPEERLRLFGQEDHVRLYGKDYYEHFEKYGFDLSVFSPYSEMEEDEIEKNGFIPDDIVIVARKV